MHAWFDGVDWTDLARTKAAFVPVVDDDLDTSYFEKKHVSAKVGCDTVTHVRTAGLPAHGREWDSGGS